MAYSDDIDALNPDHRWSFDNTYNDQVGSINGTNTGCSFELYPICEDVTWDMLSNSASDTVALATSTDINNSAQTRKAVGGWFMPLNVQLPPKNIYGEGNASQAFRFILGFGNNVIFEVDDPNFNVQVYADTFLASNRSYHLFMIFEGSGYGNIVRAYLDGVLQTNANPSDREPDYATLTARTVGEFSCPAGTVAVGGSEVTLDGLEDARYNQWATWDGADAVLTTNQVRVELFEKGALPDITISTDTEVNMQTALDVYASTERPDSPLCIRIEPVSGGGNFELTLDDITFDELASIHVQYTGTDTLTLINSGTSNASITSVINGGTIILVQETTITITVKDVETSNDIENARVYIEADAGGSLNEGDEIMNTLTDSTGTATIQFSWVSNQPIILHVRKGSSTPLYQANSSTGIITSTGFTQTILLISDE